MEANVSPLANLGNLKGARRQVRLTFTKDVQAEQIYASLERLFKEAGCLTCGLGGIDLRLIREDLVIRERPLAAFKELAGVKSATIGG